MELKEFCLKTITDYEIKHNLPKYLMRVNSKRNREMKKGLKSIIFNCSLNFKYITIEFTFKNGITVFCGFVHPRSIYINGFKLENFYPYKRTRNSFTREKLSVIKYDNVIKFYEHIYTRDCYKYKLIEKIVNLYNKGIYKFTILL